MGVQIISHEFVMWIETYLLRAMDSRKIRALVGCGILVFLFGFFGSTYWVENLQWLILIGSSMTLLGIYFFFKETDLFLEFSRNKNDDVLTYFWSKLALKIWTLIFAVWMVVMVLELLKSGHI